MRRTEPDKMAEFTPQDAGYARLVDHYSRYIKSPVLRLKFLNKTLKATPPQRGVWERLPFVGSLPERALIIMELTKVLPAGSPAPLALRLTSLLYRLRYGVYGVSVVLALFVGAGLVYVASKIVASFSVATEAREAQQPARPATGAQGAQAVASIGSEAGLTPENVWLAEQGEGYEFYSNGARVLTEYETDGPARKYYEFDLEALSETPESLKVGATPIGIVYHLSESDLLPFADRYNSSLQRRSRGLLAYARDRRLYNYLIDRFGRIYRIVRDELTAHHAGNSVWSNGRKLYINLSPSFIGVSFEGNSGQAVGPDGINEAQLYAARALTLVLRSKYGIEDANCVTHGLVSVNPANRLMGFHTDWVAGFPYEALGLSDKRQAELAAISHLGFTYDRSYLAAAGGKVWPGLEQADAALRESAGKNGVTVEGQRQSQHHIYQRLYALQRAMDGRESGEVAAAGKQ